MLRIHRWENWGLKCWSHPPNKSLIKLVFIPFEKRTPISVGNLLPIFLNKRQFSMTHFSWYYANEGNKTKWVSVQRTGNEACLGPHVPLGHTVVSEMASGRSRPLFVSGSWASSSSWPWLEGWLPTFIPLETISSGRESCFAASRTPLPSLVSHWGKR